MKVYIENLRPGFINIYNGKSKFIATLAEYLYSNGCKILDRPWGCEVNLRMNSLPSYDVGVKFTRLDDIFYCDDPIHRNIYKKGFKKIKYSLRHSDGIIYQSKIAKGIIENILKIKPKSSKIIYNGIKCDRELEEWEISIPNDYKIITFACQKLFPLRRLKEFLIVWKEINKHFPKVALALVFSKKESFIPSNLKDAKNVYFFDCMPPSKLNFLLKKSLFLVSIKYQDSCPNIVSEAAHLGIPTLVSNTNGWVECQELINRNYILPCNLDNFCTIDKVDFESPHFFNFVELEKLLLKLLNEKNKVELNKIPNVLKIEYTCQRYMDYFREVLDYKNFQNNYNFPRQIIHSKRIINKIKGLV